MNFLKQLHSLFLFAPLLAGFLFSFPAWSYCDLEFAEIRTLEGGRAVEDLSEVKLGTYNVLNLEFSPGKYVTNPATGAREFTPGVITKDADQVEGIARSIKEENLDMIILQEVEGIEPLARFNEKHLDGKYEVFLQKGNDGRGIEIGFLVKRDLPFKIRMQGQTHREWKNPKSDKNEPIFSRDLPALHIRHKSTSMNDPPEFILAGTHYKSQRDRSGDPRSEFFRARQVEETKALIKSYEESYPNVPVFLGGDFNADIHSSPEFRALFDGGLMRDSFDLGPRSLKGQDRITHTFHPRGGKTKDSQLDAILANESASSSVIEAKVYRYKDSKGAEKPLPKTYDERKQNPSDHFMVVVKARLSQFFSQSR